MLERSLNKRFNVHIKYGYNQSSQRRSKYGGNIANFTNKPILNAIHVLKFRIIGTNGEPKSNRQMLLNDGSSLVKKGKPTTLGCIKRILGGNSVIVYMG